jgi:hypothetical protein
MVNPATVFAIIATATATTSQPMARSGNNHPDNGNCGGVNGNSGGSSNNNNNSGGNDD